jgi:hypothetical protein
MKKLISLISLLLFSFPLSISAHEEQQMMGWEGSSMMGMGMGGVWSWLAAIFYIVWLIAGILLAVWLWKQIENKK